MKILHVGVADPDEQPGGLNRFLDDLARAQQQRHDVRALVLGDRPSASLYTAVARLRSPFVTRMAGFVRAGMREPAVDVAHLHFALTGAAFLLGRRLGRVRDRSVVVHFHGPWAAETRVGGRRGPALMLKAAVERMVHARADRIIVLSEVFAALLRDEHAIDDARISVVPPGVDLDRFTVGDGSGLRARLGIPLDVPLVACARRLVRRMGIADGIRALAASPHRPWLVVVGDGPERATLEEEATSWLPGRAHFLGRVDDATLLEVYRAADCTIVPSTALEGFGLVCLESMASGTPVVARPQGGLVEAVGGFTEVPLLAESMTVEALGAAVDRVLEHRPDAATCREYATAFSWDASVERTDAVYGMALRHPQLLDR